MAIHKHLRCSFCGKSKESVKQFISGPSVYICNECVSLCIGLLAEGEREAAEAVPAILTPREIKDVRDTSNSNSNSNSNSSTSNMTDRELQRFSGAALIGGGVASALFWVLAAKLGTFAGDAVVRDPLWVPSQVLHVLGALLALVGLPGLFAVHRQRAGALGLVGGVLALMGTALFAADGIIALSVFPTLASAGPEILSPTGAMNRGPMLATFIAISALNMIGWVLFAAGLIRVRTLPRVTVALLAVGGILFNLPPGPVSIIVLAAGGVLWGLALAHLGAVLRRHAAAF